MGSLAVIHCNPGVPWQPKRAAYFAEGFKRAGIPYRITDSRERLDEGFPVLLGTTFWRGIEATGDFLLVDRCSFGDTEQYVSLVRNGHGRRGDHRVPEYVNAARWERMGETLKPWREPGKRIVICGQTETYSPHYRSIEGWYTKVQVPEGMKVQFRPHPAADGYLPFPRATDFEDAIAVTLNSSIGVKCVIDGIPTVTMDEGAMAWPVAENSVEDVLALKPHDREEWAHRLAWTQWHDDEIKEGTPWDFLW